MKLIDKMTKYGVWRDNQQPEIDGEYRNAVHEDLRRAVCVEVGNVAEWFHSYTGEPRKMNKISPMFRLPFDAMWVEYMCRWSLYGGLIEKPFHVGCLLSRTDNHFEKNRPDYVRDGEWAHASCMAFLQCEHDQGVMAGERFVCLVTEDHALSRIVMERFTHKDEATADTVTKQVSAATFPMMAAISFFHCSNVRISNEYPDKPLSKRFEQKHGQPLRVMKTIDIHKPRDVHGRSPEEQHSERVLQAHLVRGHFKRYNNLFGSIAGMWFWKPHVRGVGVPEQRDYEVFAPNKQHRGKCIVES